MWTNLCCTSCTYSRKKKPTRKPLSNSMTSRGISLWRLPRDVGISVETKTVSDLRATTTYSDDWTVWNKTGSSSKIGTGLNPNWVSIRPPSSRVATSTCPSPSTRDNNFDKTSLSGALYIEGLREQAHLLDVLRMSPFAVARKQAFVLFHRDLSWAVHSMSDVR